ncbi:hypothetical protein BUE80_DR010912 [Diplocarpon rosae]|nr:hypothetical protein BUE80_DR010912 [Diplocarpon rosae]
MHLKSIIVVLAAAIIPSMAVPVPSTEEVARALIDLDLDLKLPPLPPLPPLPGNGKKARNEETMSIEEKRESAEGVQEREALELDLGVGLDLNVLKDGLKNGLEHLVPGDHKF